MSQNQVYSLLKKGKFTATEIRTELNMKEQSVFNNLRRLIKHYDIKKEKISRKTYYSIT